MEVSIVLFHGTPEGCGGCSFGGCGPQAFASWRSPAPSVRLATAASLGGWWGEDNKNNDTHTRTDTQQAHCQEVSHFFFFFNVFVKTQAEEQFINPDDGIFTGGGNVPGVISN